MDKFKRSILLGVLITFSLSACGIKGPLYIPEKKYPQKTSWNHSLKINAHQSLKS
ncbi:MAG: hypothetical protein EBV25_00715 [Methylophilaceae bacterium]|nr:hypothetical protein [Methylophilaceae bacterium]